MNKRKKIIIAILTILVLLIVDRYFWMAGRAKKLWLQENGRNLGDPIAYNQDFILNDSEIIFIGQKSSNAYPKIKANRESKFYLTGCYFGVLYIYDENRNELITYFEK